MFERPLGIIGLAVTRIRSRLTGADAGRLRLCVVGVALAVGLMMVLSGIALGLASQSTVQSEDVDLWITPEGSDTGSMVLPEDGASLGDVHTVSADLQSDDRVDYTSPVLIEPVRIVDPTTENQAFVIAIGVIPAADRTISGIPIDELDPSYGYYNEGSYDGEWSGTTVATEAAMTVLGSDEPDELIARSGTGDHSLTIVDRSETTIASGIGDVPSIVVPLAELQTITGVEEADQADQILVSTTDASVRPDLEGLYPGTEVVSRAGITGSEVSTSSLPLAMAVSSFLVALVVGVLFVATMMGLELTSSRRYIAMLDAVGFSTGSRSLLVFAETLTISILGGVLGISLGLAGVVGINQAMRETVGVAVARFDPILLGYGIGVALLIGVLAGPYPVWLSRRLETVEVMSE